MEKSEKRAGLKLFLISFGFIAFFALIIVLCVVFIWVGQQFGTKSIEVSSYQSDFKFELKTDMRIRKVYSDSNDVYFSFKNDDTLDDYQYALQENGYDVTKLEDDFLSIKTTNENFVYYFCIRECGFEDATHVFENVPFYSPVHLVNESTDMFVFLTGRSNAESEKEFTTDYGYQDYVDYFSSINFTNIDYDAEEETIIYDDAIKYTFQDGKLTTLKL